MQVLIGRRKTEYRNGSMIRWTYKGLKLTFNLVGEDKCDPRKDAMDGQTYIKSE